MNRTMSDGQTTSLNQFFAGIYTWMTVGLLLSAAFAYATLNTPLQSIIFGNPIIFYGINAIELAILFGVQIFIKKLPAELSRALFLVYAAINGMFLSIYFLRYDLSSIVQTFIISAAIFGTLAVIGFRTDKDLSSWKTVLFAGMWGVFLSSIVNMFLQNTMMDMIVSGIAILVFCGLTVYDNQAYKAIYQYNVVDKDSEKKFTTLGALHMYINFIMIFVNLLKFLGNKD